MEEDDDLDDASQLPPPRGRPLKATAFGFLTTAAARRSHFPRWLGAGISLLTLAVYLTTLRNDFVLWDDNWYVVDNVKVHSLDWELLEWAFFESQTILWHPLSWISHALDYALWGANPMGHHLTSILLHALNTLLVFALVGRLFEACGAGGESPGVPAATVAATTATLFGLHPLHVESVAWVSERKDVLSAFFFLLTLLAYLRYRRAARGKAGLAGRDRFPAGEYLWCLGCATLALLSKPMAVTLPLVMLIIDWYPLRRFDGWRSLGAVLLEKAPFVALSLGVTLVTLQPSSYAQLGDLARSSVPTTIVVSCRSLAFYLSKMVWPSKLSPLYYYSHDAFSLSSRNLVPLLLVAAISGASVLLARRRKVVLATWGYFVVTLLPVLAMYRSGLRTVADRYSYLPSIGPFLMAGMAGAWAWEKAGSLGRAGTAVRRLASAAAMGVVAVLSLLTLRHIAVWRNSETLWTQVIRQGWHLGPDESVARNNLGLAFAARGEHDQALIEYTRALRMNPFSHQALNNLGVTLGKMGRFKESMAYFSEAIRIKPDYAEAHGNLGVALEGVGRGGEAIERYREALRLNPLDRNARHNLEQALARSPR